ncbi:hypothetical protein [Mycolicibacter sinensis]|uniref:ESX-1 secretion-associated protein EspA/EspE-like domain-containing protein n=1 Tax=Mycolicibacter sinensis (strain JDM601) TaxID=875328 RepID=A0A1A3U6L3_MYCSD|nr:hypothetical protein [Mycolicibacter sinensis]OBK90474.1 hypothetical protein A5648_17085 [Mycolicibacter sinensis]
MSGLPTLSEVRAASWDHLRTNAAAWRNLGRTWEAAFTEVHQSSLRPGGTDWTGAGAEAFQDRAYLDLVKIRTPVDTTDTLAGIAERGADAQDGNKSSVLDTVDEIESDNFAVGEDWSVTDKITWYSSAAELEQRELEAQGRSDFLKSKVIKLAGDEDDISRNLTTAAADLHGFRFPDEGADGDGGGSGPTKAPSDDSADPGAKPGEPGGPEFVIGPPTKPVFEHDEDFEYGSAKPTWRDYISRAEWEAKLAGGRLLRPDLDDATQMYKHYWDNDGKPIKFDYEEAFREDPTIRTNVEDQISRAQRGAEDLIRAGNTSFSMTGDASPAAAYPTTENWQKAIGGYQQWSSADVQVDGNKATMTVTVHAEDHYNFNRGQADIATGAADNVNGRFTELGWGKPFDSHGEVTRTVTWDLGNAPATQSGNAPAFNPGREDRVDGFGSSGGIQLPANDRSTGSARMP